MKKMKCEFEVALLFQCKDFRCVSINTFKKCNFMEIKVDSSEHVASQAVLIFVYIIPG